jgi:hypothetical protein
MIDDSAIKVMKLNVLDTHDRLLELHKTLPKIISQGAEECLKRNPDSLAIQAKCPYVYIFAHPRTMEDGATKRMLWQPRISKPIPEPNSYLFRAISNTDTIEVIWLLPAMETWGQHQKRNITESDKVQWSIAMYLHNRNELKRPHPQDWSEEHGKIIFMEILNAMKGRKFNPDLPELSNETK